LIRLCNFGGAIFEESTAVCVDQFLALFDEEGQRGFGIRRDVNCSRVEPPNFRPQWLQIGIIQRHRSEFYNCFGCADQMFLRGR